MQLGRYEVIRKLGEGDVARVLLAKSASGETVVLKVPVEDQPELAERLRDEARMGLRARHPSVVDTLELFEHEGQPILVVEYVEGASLRELRRRAGAMPPGLVARIGRQVAEGLAFLHEGCDDDDQPLNLVHGDVTPANILVTPDGNAKLIGLGIARGREPPATSAEAGTVGYLAPELLDGGMHAPGTDLWALGVVLFEAALGRRAAEGDEQEVLAAISRGDIAKLREGEALEETLRDGLEALLAPRESRLQRARAAVNVLGRIEDLLPKDEAWCRREVGEVLARTDAGEAAEDTAPADVRASSEEEQAAEERSDPRPRVGTDEALEHLDGAAPTVQMSAVELAAIGSHGQPEPSPRPFDAAPPTTPTDADEALFEATRSSSAVFAASSSFEETQKFPKPGPADSPLAPDQSLSLPWRIVAAPTLLGVTATEVTPATLGAFPAASAPGESAPPAGPSSPLEPWRVEPVIPAEPHEQTEAGAPPPRRPNGWSPTPAPSSAPPGAPTHPGQESSDPLPRMLRSPASAEPAQAPLDPAHRPPDPRALGIPTPHALEAAGAITPAPGVLVPEESTETAFPIRRPGSLPPADALAPGIRPAPAAPPANIEAVLESDERTLRMPPAPRAGFVGQRANPDDATERVERWTRSATRADVAELDEPLAESELAWRPSRAKHIAIGVGVALAVAIATVAVLVLLT